MRKKAHNEDLGRHTLLMVDLGDHTTCPNCGAEITIVCPGPGRKP